MPIKPEGKEEEISERDSIVDSIVEENEEDQKQYEGDVEPDQEEEILEEKKEPEDDKSESEYQIEQEKLLEKKEPEEEMVEIVVYGEKKMVPLSEIKAAGIRDMQKESAADERLSDAKELLKEVKALKSQPEEEEEVKGMTPKEIAYAIQYGTEEEAATAIEQIGVSQNNAQPGVTTEDVQKMVNTTVEDSNNSRNIFDKFNMPKDKGGFFDITEDPNLMDMAVSNVDKRLKKGETNSWETYEKAGNDIRGWLAKFQPEKSDFADKKDKKKTIDNIPAASAVQDLKKPKDKGQTATEVIEEMGAGRPGR